MQLFYTNNIQGNLAHFSEEEARHLVQVLRHKVGDSLYFVDGLGTLYQGAIVETGKKACVLSILHREEAYKQRPFQLYLAIAPTKNIARMEWFLEKATELGVDHIIPLQSQHSERGKLRPERLEKVLLSAMKQSLKAYLPRLAPLTTFADLMKMPNLPARRFIAHCADGEKQLLGENYSAGQDVMVLIGPEGDFSPKEVALAQSHGFEAISLGESRLRTETAGITACAILNYLNEQKSTTANAREIEDKVN